MARTRPSLVSGSTRRPASRTTLDPQRLSDDLSAGVIILLSGGVWDDTNPPEVTKRMDQTVADVNNDPYVKKHTGDKGLRFLLLKDQEKPHIHHSRWEDVCERLQKLVPPPSPLIVVGHSNGGAAAMSLARCVADAGLFVDLLVSCDSVLTTNDLGDPNEVPKNVLFNINSYVIPTKHFWKVPFFIGRRTRREGAGHPFEAIINIGLEYALGGAIAHRNAFYELAGGDTISKKKSYRRPHVVLDTILAVLRGESHDSMFDAIKKSLKKLSTLSKIPIDLDAEGVQETIRPVRVKRRR
jgi:hypothetical protein